MKNPSVKLFSLVAALLLSACEGEHHGKYVKDANGKIYKLEHRLGQVYALDEISTDEIDSLNQNRND